MEPTIEGFEKWLTEKGDTVLIPFQMEVASMYIDLRKKLFSGGRRSGRSFILNLLRQYFDENFPIDKYDVI